MIIPASAAPDVQSAFRDLYRKIEPLVGSGNIDLQQRRVINAGNSIGRDDYITRNEVVRRVEDLRRDLTESASNLQRVEGDLLVPGRLTVGWGVMLNLAQATILSAQRAPLALAYDVANYVTFTVSSIGALTVAATGTNPNIVLTPGGVGNVILNGKLGVSATTVSAKVHITSTTEQLRLGYDVSNYLSLTINASGSMALAATGTNPYLAFAPGGTGNSYFTVGALSVGIGAGGTVSAKLHVLATTEQLRLGYDASNYNQWVVGSTGSLRLTAVGTNPDIRLTPGGTGYVILDAKTGIGTTTPSVQLEVLSTAQQLRLSYDASNTAQFTTNSVGTLAIAVAGTNPSILLTPGGTGTVTISSQAKITGSTVSGFINFIEGAGWDVLGYVQATSQIALGGYRASQWSSIAFYSSASARVTITAGMMVGAVADQGAGTINVSGNIYKNGTAYNNPHGGFEAAYTGRLVRFADRMATLGLATYRHWSIDDLETYTRRHFHFPYFEDEAKVGYCDGGEKHLLMTELLAVYLFDHEARLRRLEAA